MMKTPEQLKGAIRNLAKKKGIHAQEVLQIFMFERIIERLSVSPYKDRFILKGGLLISAILGVAERTTMDVQDIPIEKADGRIIKVQGGGFQPFVLFGKKKSPDILTGKLLRVLILIFQEIRDVVFIAGNGTFFEVTDFSGFLKLF